MAEMIIGGFATAGFILLVQSARSRALTIAWWQWGLTILGFLYGVFVLEVVVSFLEEGTPKGAAVVGTILGFVAVVWGILLGRFVFRAGQPTAPAEAPQP
jgi:hypothetical protein